MSQPQDSRLYARFELNECAMISREAQEEPYRTILVDIGLGGAQLRSKEPLPTGELLNLTLGRDGKPPVTLKGIVRYSHPTDEAESFVNGFKFAPETHAERVTIAEFVHEVFQRQWEILAS